MNALLDERSNLGIFLSPRANQCGRTIVGPGPQLSPEIKTEEIRI